MNVGLHVQLKLVPLLNTGSHTAFTSHGIDTQGSGKSQWVPLPTNGAMQLQMATCSPRVPSLPEPEPRPELGMSSPEESSANAHVAFW